MFQNHFKLFTEQFPEINFLFWTDLSSCTTHLWQKSFRGHNVLQTSLVIPCVPSKCQLFLSSSWKALLSICGYFSYFQNCSTNPERSMKERLTELNSVFVRHYTKTSGACQESVAQQRFTEATNLYFRVMKKLLDMVAILFLILYKHDFLMKFSFIIWYIILTV